MQGQIASKPLRMPSVMRKRGERPVRGAAGDIKGPVPDPATEISTVSSPDQGAAAQFVSALDTVTRSLSGTNTNPYFVFCLKPNDRRIANQFDSKCVRTQIRTFGIAEISQRIRNADFSVFLPFGEFLGLTEAENVVVGSEKEKTEFVVEERNWPMNEARVGATGIFLSERCWFEIANIGEGGSAARRSMAGAGFLDSDNHSDPLTPVEPGGGHGGLFGGSDSRVKLITSHGAPGPGGLGTHIYGTGAGKGGYFSKADDLRSEAAASAFHSGDMFKNFDTPEKMAEKGQAAREQEIEELPVTAGRKRWMFGVWAITWFIPDFLIRWVGGMKRKDIQVAWREKLAINFMIWFMCGLATFFIGKSYGVVHVMEQLADLGLQFGFRF